MKGILFCLPWLLGLSAFLAYPVAAALYYSCCDYSVLLPPKWVGAGNYQALLADELFWQGLWNTSLYASGSVLLGMVTALTLALLLNTRVRGLAFYRTLFYLPTLMPVVASCMLWLWIFNGQSGLANNVLELAGIDGPAWLQDPDWAKAALVIMSAWGCGNTMLILLAGLQDVPQGLLEAARIDGAGFWDRLRHITLPMLSPVLYFNVIMGIIGGFQVFTQAFVMTGSSGAPERSTLFYVLHLYNLAFQDLRMGMACAMAVILFVIILGLTLVMQLVARRWVHYDR